MKKIFEELKMDLSLAEALEKEGIKELTDVQKKVLPEAVKNRDLIVE